MERGGCSEGRGGERSWEEQQEGCSKESDCSTGRGLHFYGHAGYSGVITIEGSGVSPCSRSTHTYTIRQGVWGTATDVHWRHG